MTLSGWVRRRGLETATLQNRTQELCSKVKFPDFQAAKDFYTVDGSRKWSAGDDWFYDIQERK